MANTTTMPKRAAPKPGKRDPATCAPEGCDGDTPEGLDYVAPVDRIIDASLAPDPTGGGILAPLPTRMATVKWLWEGWLPRGHLTLLAAAGGVGKGTFWAYLAACVTNERPWPDGSKSDPGNVAILSPDDAMADTIVPRLKLSGADLDRCLHVPPDPRRNPLDQLLALKHADDLKLIVADVLGTGLSSSRSTNSADDVADHLDRFRAVAQRTGAAVLAVHHVAKWSGMKVREGASLSDVVRGSGAFVDKPRMVWMLFHDRQDRTHYSRLLCRAKTNIGGTQIHEGGYRVIARPATYTDDADGSKGETFVVTSAAYESGPVDELFEEAQKFFGTKTRDAAQAILGELQGDPSRMKLKAEVLKALTPTHGVARTIERAAKELEGNGLLKIRKKQPAEFPGTNPNAVVWELP